MPAGAGGPSGPRFRPGLPAPQKFVPTERTLMISSPPGLSEPKPSGLETIVPPPLLSSDSSSGQRPGSM